MLAQVSLMSAAQAQDQVNQSANQEGGQRIVKTYNPATAPLPPPPPGSQPPSTNPRSFEGFWLGPSLGPGPDAPIVLAPPSYTQQAAATLQRWQRLTGKAPPRGGFATQCRPAASMAFRTGADLFPAEIVQERDEVVILNEEGRGRWQIAMKRGHPHNLKPTYWGDSIGHWEGNTLVIDTTGVYAQAESQNIIDPNTHMVTRIRKIDGGRRLEVTTTFIDPQIYTRPYQTLAYAHWHPELRLLDYQCEENPVGAGLGVR